MKQIQDNIFSEVFFFTKYNLFYRSPCIFVIFFAEHRNYTGLKAVVTGWGRTGESKPPSNEMRKVEVPIMSIEDCRKNSGYVPSRITENMMCAGYSGGQKDSCQVRIIKNLTKNEILTFIRFYI